MQSYNCLHMAKMNDLNFILICILYLYVLIEKDHICLRQEIGIVETKLVSI